MPRKEVLLVHEGDRNWKLVGIGVLIVFVGLMIMGAMSDKTFGGVTAFAGFICAMAGFQKLTKPCPHCRTRVSRKAGTCPQCHQVTGFA